LAWVSTATEFWIKFVGPPTPIKIDGFIPSITNFFAASDAPILTHPYIVTIHLRKETALLAWMDLCCHHCTWMAISTPACDRMLLWDMAALPVFAPMFLPSIHADSFYSPIRAMVECFQAT
jgi:hypothetical protein